MFKIRHAVMGWVFEEVGKRVVRKKIAQKRQEFAESKVKIGAAGVVALVLIGGVVAAKAGSGDD
jgi:hypothetical protein